MRCLSKSKIKLYKYNISQIKYFILTMKIYVANNKKIKQL